jgi:alkyldihydroxyacetonephosphate synthase
MDQIKKAYLTKIKNFDLTKMCAATLLYEGDYSEVSLQKQRVMEIASKYGGLSGGPENGRRGYFLTYMIAYIRDLGLEYRFLSESFETSIPWKDVVPLCERVKKRIVDVCKAKGFVTTPFSSCRVTQVYDTGACVYFYFGVKWDGPTNPGKAFAELEEEAREEVLACGGSLSHHHGVGKLRKKWMKETVSPLGMEMIHAVKKTLDPTNIFANGNLL